MNECAAERIAMNADAHRTSTTTTAAGTGHVGVAVGCDSTAGGVGVTMLAVMRARLAPGRFDAERSVDGRPVTLGGLSGVTSRLTLRVRRA